MLTKQDLNAIGELIDKKLESKLEEKLESKLEEKLDSKLEEKILPIRTSIKILQKDVSTIKKDVKKLRTDLDGAINFFNHEDLATRKGINNTRAQLGMDEVVFGN